MDGLFYWVKISLWLNVLRDNDCISCLFLSRSDQACNVQCLERTSFPFTCLSFFIFSSWVTWQLWPISAHSTIVKRNSRWDLVLSYFDHGTQLTGFRSRRTALATRSFFRLFCAADLRDFNLLVPEGRSLGTLSHGLGCRVLYRRELGWEWVAILIFDVRWRLIQFFIRLLLIRFLGLDCFFNLWLRSRDFVFHLFCFFSFYLNNIFIAMRRFRTLLWLFVVWARLIWSVFDLLLLFSPISFRDIVCVISIFWWGHTHSRCALVTLFLLTGGDLLFFCWLGNLHNWGCSGNSLRFQDFFWNNRLWKFLLFNHFLLLGNLGRRYLDYFSVGRVWCSLNSI